MATRKSHRNNGDDHGDLIMPAKLKGLKCGCSSCDKTIDFDKLSKGQKYRVIKKAENEWKTAADNKDTPCYECVQKLKDANIQCNKLVLKNGKSMSWIDGPRGYKQYKFENEANAVITDQQNDRKYEAESQASSTEFDLQTDSSRRVSDSDAWTKTCEPKPSLQQLLDSAQDPSHRDYLVYKSKIIEMFDSDGYGK